LNKRKNNNNGKKNNNNHKNGNNKKKVKKVVKKDIDKTVTVHHDIPSVPQQAVQAGVVHEIINSNENVNVNENVNENVNTVESARQEIVYQDREVVVEKPVQEIVYQDREVVVEQPTREIVYVDRPVEEVEEHVVYPVQSVTTTPETGAESLALLALPGMAGAGVFLRRKLSI
jgi:hypothetical protein